MAAPAGYSSLGLVGFTDMGNYNAQLSYMKNDLTHSSGKIWRSKVDDNVGHTPEEGAYWTLWIDAPENLSELQDVYIYNPANGDILSYNATLGQWTKSDALGKDVNIRARLGAHNINKSEQTFTINNTTSPKRFYVGGVSNLKQSEQLTISFDVSAVSGYSGSNALRVDMVADSLVSPMDDCGVSVTHYEKSISVFNDVELTDTNVYFELRIPAGESSSATVTISNLLIKFANDASSEVTPFAEDNEVLTGKIASVGSEVNSVKTAFVNNVENNGSKNVLPNEIYTQTIGNVTITVYDDLSFKANGTANANIDLPLFPTGTTLNVPEGDYVLSSGSNLPSGVYLGIQHNVSGWKDITNGNSSINVSFASGQYISKGHFYIANGTTVSNLMVYPMLCLKSDWEISHDYAPYAKTNRQLTKETTGLIDNTMVNGAVNMLRMYAGDYSVNGVTYHCNNDETVLLTASGNTTGGSIFVSEEFRTIKAGTYKISGSPTWNAPSGKYISVTLRDRNNNIYARSENGAETVFTLSADTEVRFVCFVDSGINPNGIVIKPMLAVPDYTGGHAPYAKSNGELTGLLTIKEMAVSGNSGSHGEIPAGFTSDTYKKIPLNVNWTSTEKPANTSFAWNSNYQSWYIVCEDWDGVRQTNKDFAGTLRYLDLS